jgi:hypothetical protein
MSGSIVQKFAANFNPGYSYAAAQSAAPLSPITIGNFLIALVSNTGRTDTPTVVDTLNAANVFEEVIGGANSGAGCSCSIWIAPILAAAGGTCNVEATWGGSNNSHLAVYEVSGIGGTADQTDYTNEGTGSGTSKTTTSAGELCFSIVVNQGSYGAYDLTPSGSWTWDFPGAAGQQAASSVASQVQASAGAIQATFAGSAFSGGIAMATFAAPAGNAYDPTKPFIGSVRVLGSAPAGEANEFIGTMRVLVDAPAGEANPYLGSVTVGTPSSGDSNPALGQVVIVSSVPAGETDEYLGQIEES